MSRNRGNDRSRVSKGEADVDEADGEDEADNNEELEVAFFFPHGLMGVLGPNFNSWLAYGGTKLFFLWMRCCPCLVIVMVFCVCDLWGFFILPKMDR